MLVMERHHGPWTGLMSEEWKVIDESDIDREGSREELSGYEGPRGVKCCSIEGNDGAGCVRAIVGQNKC